MPRSETQRAAQGEADEARSPLRAPSQNARRHGLTAPLPMHEVEAWRQVVTDFGRLTPEGDSGAHAVAWDLAEAEVRLARARAHYCDCLAELGRPEPPHKLPKDFGPVMQALARQLTRDMAEGLAVDPAALGILTAMERTARGTGAGMPVGGLRDFRLAARYLAEAASRRRRCLREWINHLNTISRNEPEYTNRYSFGMKI